MPTRATKNGPRDEIFAGWHTDLCPVSLLTVDADLCVLDVDANALGFWGRARENLRGQRFCDLFTSPEAALSLCKRALELGLAQGHFLDVRLPDGSVIPLLCRAERRKGRAKLVQVSARRVSRVSEAEAVIGDAGRMIRDAFECANIGMALIDPAGNLLQTNRKAAETFGFTSPELESMNLSDLIYSEDRHPSPSAAIPPEETPDRGASERRFLHRNGMILFIDFSYAMVRDEAGSPRYLVASFRDVTEHRRLEILLKEQASIDPLTRTLNRSRLEERGKVEALRAERYRHQFSVAMVDLDYFKVVNDTYGHAAGDLVLSGFAEISHGCLRLSDEIGRWGGEEFVILLPDTGPSGAGRVSDRLRICLQEFIFPGGIRATASIGIAALRKGDSFASLVHRADAAMYRAKQGGRNRVVLDDQDLAEELSSRSAPRALIQLQWKKSFASGQSLIDGEHRALMQAANRLLVASSAYEGVAEISSLTRELLNEAQAHFAHEEELLLAARYPRFEQHREIHLRLLAKAEEMFLRIDHGEAAVGDLVGFVIHDLVARHILREDREFFPWVQEFVLPVIETH